MGINTDYLVDHAIKNVWCSPDQDLQAIFKPTRISHRDGARNTVEILLETYKLPTQNEWYHVFQIGELTPSLLGLQDSYNTWISCQHQINTRNLILDVYTKEGLQYPKATCFLFRTKESGVVLAVKEQPTISNLIYDDIFLRCYTNAYFASGRNTGADEGTKAFFRNITRQTDIQLHMLDVSPYKTKKGLLYNFVNGEFVENISDLTAAIGDVVESIWDSSIKEVREFPVSTLDTFISARDSKLKYLLHDKTSNSSVIDFKDDNDIFLIKRTSQYLAKGRFFHHNAVDSCRMVTHRDYSIPTSYVQNYINGNDDWNTQEELTVRLHIRHSGFLRDLVDEHDRIKELYKLAPHDRHMALLGINAVIPNWTASSLENGNYIRLMDKSKFTKITPPIVLDAYGYNATSKLLADSPLKRGDDQLITLPVGLRCNSTIYEYDVDGVLLNYHLHETGKYYVVRNSACRLIEGIVGIASTRLTTDYQTRTKVLNQETNYAFYKTPLINSVPDGLGWSMAEEDVDYKIETVNGKKILTWLIDQTRFYTAVKDDERFLAYDLNLDYRDGILRFTVNKDEIRTDEELYRHKAEIPFGKFELFLNGRKLIKGLGYTVNWPEICIFNKEYLIEGPQRLTIRGTGFCDETMYLEPNEDYGWVVHGEFSRNNRYDIRDDKVLRMAVDGRTIHRDDLKFVEDTGGITVPGISNGEPYLIEDTIIPLRLDCDFHDQFEYRKKSKDLDTLISGYMTALLPEPVISTPNPIPRLHQIYSPYCSKIMWNLVHGLIRDQDISGVYNDQQLLEMLKPFDWLIKYDPCFQPIDLDYVVIHPHNLYTEVELTHNQWVFLSRAVNLKLGDRVDLSHFVTIN